MHLTTTVWAADLPPEVSQPFITLGGYFLTLLNLFAAIHLIFLGASIAWEKVKDRPMTPRPSPLRCGWTLRRRT